MFGLLILIIHTAMLVLAGYGAYAYSGSILLALSIPILYEVACMLIDKELDAEEE